MHWLNKSGLVTGIKWTIIRWKDRVRYSPITGRLVLAGALAKLLFVRSNTARANLLIQAYRRAEKPRQRDAILQKAQSYLGEAQGVVWRDKKINWSRYPQVTANPLINRSIVLKAPRHNSEKGVMLVMFEYNWLRLLMNRKVADYINQHFDIILSTSWSPTDYTLLALALNSLQGTIFVQACNYGEIPWIEQFSPRLKCLPCIACDWINPESYKPKPFAERKTDILMVSNWAPFKRHWQLFDALRRMPRSLRVTLIGQKEGRYTLAMLRNQAALFGVKQDINFLENISIDEVNRHQCDSKISLIMSRREGCCVAAVESLFANSPLGMMRNAHVGPTTYINDQTGMLLASDHLDLQLQKFIEQAEGYQPRTWAMENISCFKSAAKLNALFRQYAQQNGRPWTADLKIPHWRPYPIFFHPTDREEMRPVYEDLHHCFPEVFGAELLEKGST